MKRLGPDLNQAKRFRTEKGPGLRGDRTRSRRKGNGRIVKSWFDGDNEYEVEQWERYNHRLTG